MAALRTSPSRISILCIVVDWRSKRSTAGLSRRFYLKYHDARYHDRSHIYSIGCPSTCAGRHTGRSDPPRDYQQRRGLDAESKYASIIAGLAGHDIEDVKLSNIRIHYKGGGTREDAAREVQENEKSYPEPSMFGVIPAYGFYVRHVNGIAFDNVNVSYEKDDARPAFDSTMSKTRNFFRSNVELAGKERCSRSKM